MWTLDWLVCISKGHPLGGVLLRRWMQRELRAQGNVSGCPYYQVVQNKACPARIRRVDGKASGLQTLETWLIVIDQLIPFY